MLKMECVHLGRKDTPVKKRKAKLVCLKFSLWSVLSLHPDIWCRWLADLHALQYPIFAQNVNDLLIRSADFKAPVSWVSSSKPLQPDNEFLVPFDISQSWAALQKDLLKLILSEQELHTNRKIPVKGLLRNSVAFSDCPTKKFQIN